VVGDSADGRQEPGRTEDLGGSVVVADPATAFCFTDMPEIAIKQIER
jgi:hypothetical protein